MATCVVPFVTSLDPPTIYKTIIGLNSIGRGVQQHMRWWIIFNNTVEATFSLCLLRNLVNPVNLVNLVNWLVNLRKSLCNACVSSIIRDIGLLWYYQSSPMSQTLPQAHSALTMTGVYLLLPLNDHFKLCSRHRFPTTTSSWTALAPDATPVSLPFLSAAASGRRVAWPISPVRYWVLGEWRALCCKQTGTTRAVGKG
ncbi:hypothetical protein K438DRAFT_1783329 [Mycena galopus ATCC 62051]|nr:hypothetical protein K438DRAFT_1783329 [Mycena galopus ATCC 62051]